MQGRMGGAWVHGSAEGYKHLYLSRTPQLSKHIPVLYYLTTSDVHCYLYFISRCTCKCMELDIVKSCSSLIPSCGTSLFSHPLRLTWTCYRSWMKIILSFHILWISDHLFSMKLFFVHLVLVLHFSISITIIFLYYHIDHWGFCISELFSHYLWSFFPPWVLAFDTVVWRGR